MVNNRLPQVFVHFREQMKNGNFPATLNCANERVNQNAMFQALKSCINEWVVDFAHLSNWYTFLDTILDGE